MDYAQLDSNQLFYRTLNNGVNYEWDATHYCTAEALTPTEKTQFNVVEFLHTAPPTYDPFTEKAVNMGGINIGGQWQTYWEIIALTQQEQDDYLVAEKQRVFIDIRLGTEARLDAWAAERLYTGIASLCTFDTSTTPKYVQEAADGNAGRDATWLAVEQIVQDVHDGLRPLPTGYAEIEPELPPLNWTAPATNISF